MYQQTNQQQQQVDLEDLDFANFVLSELKRSAREYTTAALEAANPGIRQTFETLLQKTLDDQALIFKEIEKLGGYQIGQAEQQQIEQELQKQSQTAIQVQSIVGQYVGGASSANYTQQDRSSVQATQSQQYTSYQSQFQQTDQQQQYQQRQAPTPSFQPVNYASQYPNAVYNNQQGRGQGQGYTPSQSQQPSSSYNQTQSRSYQDQSHEPAGYGRGQQGYAASSNHSNENAGMTGTGRASQARIVSRTQPGLSSSNPEGNKYNF